MKTLSTNLLIILLIVFMNCQNSHLQSVKFYLSQREWEKAKTALNRLIEQTPHNGELHFHLGNVAAHLNDFKTMHEEFQKCQQYTNRFEYKINYLLQKYRIENYNSGIALQEQKLYEQAILKFTYVTLIDTTYSNAYVQIAHIYLDQGDNEKAIANYKKAINLNKKDIVARNNLAAIYFKQGDLAKTISVCHEILKINKKHYDTILRLAYCHDLQNDYENAIKWYEQAIKLNPVDKKLYVNLGINYHKIKYHEAAITEFKKALTLDSASVKVFNYLGESYREIHKYDEMISCYNHLVELDSTNHDAWKNLIAAYSILGKKDSAQETLEQMEKTLKHQPGVIKN